jgi:uncharacterized protein with FMN-binding domain
VARKTPRKLVALSGSAIAAIYVAGYVATSRADARLNAAPSASAVAAAAAATTGPTLAITPTAGSPLVPPVRGPGQSTPASAAGTPTAAGAYRDGTYTGSGDSRRGGFSVAVTVRGGRIAEVEITDAWTQYPASRVAALPGQVLARQSARVDRVSGATYSGAAFQQAVQQALAQASGAGAAPPSQPVAPPAVAPPVGRPGQSVQPLPGRTQPRQRDRRGDRG